MVPSATASKSQSFRLSIAITLGSLSALAIYLFITSMLEAMWLLFHMSLELKSLYLENGWGWGWWCYRISFAFIACTLAEGVFVRIWLGGPRLAFVNSHSFNRKKIVHNALVSDWVFVNFLAKILIAFYFFVESICAIYDESTLLLFMVFSAVAAMYLHGEHWRGISKIGGQKARKWGRFSGMAIMFCSLLLSFIEPLGLINLKAPVLDMHKSLDRPSSTYLQKWENKQLQLEIFLVKPVPSSPDPTLYIYDEQIPWDSLSEVVDNFKEAISERNKGKVCVAINAHRDTKMADINRLTDSILATNTTIVFFTTQHSFQGVRFYQNHGILMKLFSKDDPSVAWAKLNDKETFSFEGNQYPLDKINGILGETWKKKEKKLGLCAANQCTFQEFIGFLDRVRLTQKPIE